MHPFKIKLQTSSPCGPGIFGPESFDWARVQHDFDYVWAYDVPQLYPPLSAIGKLVFENGDGDVRVFRLNKPSAGVALRGNRATDGTTRHFLDKAGTALSQNVAAALRNRQLFRDSHGEEQNGPKKKIKPPGAQQKQIDRAEKECATSSQQSKA